MMIEKERGKGKKGGKTARKKNGGEKTLLTDSSSIRVGFHSHDLTES